MYGVKVNLWEAVKSFYCDSKACTIRANGKLTE